MLNLSGLSLTVFILISLVCCNAPVEKSSSNGQETDRVVQDTVLKKEIDSIIDQINLSAAQQGEPIRIPFTLYNPNDTLKYWNHNGVPARVWVYLGYPDKMVWPTFFIHNGEPILARFRMWSKTPPEYVMENLAYLKNGKIVYCMERSIELKTGELPYLLRDKEFSACTRTPEEIKKDYSEYYIVIDDFLKKHLQQAK